MAREPGTQRVCIIHRNVPNTIATFTATCGQAGVNIENMQSKSRGEYAYTVLDVTGDLSSGAVEALENLEPIIKVRSSSNSPQPKTARKSPELPRGFSHVLF